MPDEIIRYDQGWRFDDGHFYDQPPTIPLTVPPLPPHKEKGKHMDFVPRQRNDRYQWYQNLSTNVVAEAVKMGVPSADATAVKALADGCISKIGATDTAQAA